MGSFSYLGLVLSCVFSVIILGLIAELCYFIWWKNSLNSSPENKNFLFCWKKPISAELNPTSQPTDLELGNSREILLKEESVESELIRLHNLSGPPRFLFTIKEETKEELESSEDGASKKNSKTKSLSDIVKAEDFEFDHHNPLFESFTEEDLKRLTASPPSKFKFLRDAEEKLIQHLVEEAGKKVLKKNGEFFKDSLEEKNRSFTLLNSNR